MADDGFNSEACAVRQLSCAERTALKRQCVARANEERQQLLRRLPSRLATALRLACRRLNELRLAVTRRLIARERRMQALRQLAGMSDRELRDIGISRLDIVAAARSDAARLRGDLSALGIQATQGEKHAKGLLDCPRLCS
jgi:uncharacterized protein YjiS (DUF1127 family)